MKVRAELYSRLKEIVDASLLELSLPENATVKDLFEQLKERYPQLRDFERSVLFGIGVEFVDRNHPLNEGDTIAIMPPVQGGLFRSQKSEIRFWSRKLHDRDCATSHNGK
jgi:molybdopterin converting factor small subunit